MKNILTIALCLFTLSAVAQSKKKQDREAIKAMCGCYEVSFNFAETFASDKDYKFKDNYVSKGLEWAQLVEDEKDKISIQHLLIVAPKTIVKHWRQDWLYENTDLYSFEKNRTWKYEQLDKAEVKGQWTQRVFQVDDSPRYEGSATWVHVDGRSYWESTVDSPLPRREASKRSDYNLMVRTNRQEITDYGWLHEQDNDKVIRRDTDELLAREKGWNTYTKVDDAKCQDAQEWWAKNQQYWEDVRTAWAQVYGSKETLTFKRRVEKKVMFERLFALGDELVAASDYNSEATTKQVKDIIESYLD